MNLSKKDKKAAKEIITKGMHAEFHRGMQHFDAIMQKWRASSNEDQTHYSELYGAIRTFDKQIAFRYDALKGSDYMDIIFIQLIDNLIALSDLETLSAENKDYISRKIQSGNSL